MRSSFTKLVHIIAAFIVIFCFSCRDSFDEDFRVVSIVNNAPTFSSIDTLFLSVGFGSEVIDLSAYFTDVESDPINYTASSSDENVVGLSVAGSKITFTEGGELGSSKITVTATDGNEGNDVSTSFIVEVSEGGGPSFVYGFDFTRPNGSTDNDISWPSGADVSFEQSEGTVRTIESGAMVMDISPEGFIAMNLSLQDAADISNNPIIQFDYANNANPILDLQFFDATGAATDFIEVRNLITGSSEFNTFSIDLSDYADQIDLTQFKEMFMEKYIDWGEEFVSGEVDNGTTWTIDNFYISFQEGVEISFEYCQEYTLAQGTMDEDITWPSGANVSFEFSDGSSRTIQSGTSVWNISPEGYMGMTLILNESADITDNPVFQLDYANSKNPILDLQFFDATGAATEFIEIRDLEIDNPDINTFSIDLSQYSDQIDLTQFSQLYMEKYIDWGEEFVSGEVDNGTSWVIDNVCISKN